MLLLSHHLVRFILAVFNALHLLLPRKFFLQRANLVHLVDYAVLIHFDPINELDGTPRTQTFIHVTAFVTCTHDFLLTIDRL